MRSQNNKRKKMIKLGIIIAIPVVVGIIIFAFIYNGLRIDKIKKEINNGNFIVAEEMLEDYKGSNSSSADVYKLYAELYLAQNQPEKAIEKLEEGLRKVSSTSEKDLQNKINDIMIEYNISETGDADNEQVSIEPTDVEKYNNYLTQTEWADLSNYMFAVENDNYNGDVFESGSYLFSPICVIESKDYVPTVWDIYISKNSYDNTSQLLDNELIGSVGGNEQLTLSVKLEKGDYVYVIYNETALTPTGMLNIEKQ